jgi:hypothetical protein
MGANGSLLLEAEAAEEREDAQLLLLFDADLPKFIDRTKPAFDYTGERLFRDRPDVYMSVVKLLAEQREQVSYRQVARLCHVTHRTIKAVEVREGLSIATRKKDIAELYEFGAQAMVEKAIELAPTMKSAKDAAISAGIFGEKFLQFSGEATQRIEIGITVGNIHDELRRFHEETMRMVEAQVVNTGIVGENVWTKALAGPTAAIEPPAGVIEGESDVLSDVSNRSTQENRSDPAEIAADLSDSAVLGSPDAGSSEPGGEGGVSPGMAPAISPTGKPRQNFTSKGESEA